MATASGGARTALSLVLILITLAGGAVLGAAGMWWLGGESEASPDAAAGAAQGPPPATVRLAQARRQALQNSFDVVGRLRELQRVAVAAEVGGKIIAVPVEEGDRVTGNETVLAQIEAVWAELELQAAEARVQSALARLDQSRRDYQYLVQLQQANSARPKEVDDAKATMESDQATYEAAVADRDLARERVERLVVVAPFDGVVVDKRVELGQWVEPGTEVAEIVSIGHIEAMVNVPEGLVNQVEIGQTVSVLVEPLGERLDGTVAAIIPAGTNAARTYPVKIRLGDGGGRLKPGMSVVASLPLGEEEEHLAVPRDAVVYSGSDAAVWVAQPGEPMPTAARVPVRILFGAGDDYAVQPQSDSLQAGSSVVVEGAELLTPTQPLIVTTLPDPSGLSHAH